MLRAIRDDLVEKRLWPVAVVLVLLLVGTPIVLARGGSATPAPAAPAPPAPVASAGAAAGGEPVVLARTPRQVAPTGRFRDPFRPTSKHGARATSAAATAAAAPAGTATAIAAPPSPSLSAPPSPTPPAGASSPSPPSHAGSSGPSATTVKRSAAPAVKSAAPAARPAPAPRPEPTGVPAGYRVDVSWGDPAGPRSTHDIARLAILRAGRQPALIFLGVRPDGDRAVFLVAAKAKASGDGRCRPTGEYCHVIELQRGDSEFLDVATAEGIVQYELHVDRVAPRRAADPAAARRALARFSEAGLAARAVLVHTGRSFARHLVYVPSRGVLVFRSKLPVAPAAGQ